MGYDLNIGVLKKKTLEKLQKEYPKSSFETLFYNFLFMYFYEEDFNVPNDEKGRSVVWSNMDIFSDFFKRRLKDEEIIIIEESTYNKMIAWLEEQLKSKTMFDFVSINDDLVKYTEMMKAYRRMLDEKIDFDTELVIFQHG